MPITSGSLGPGIVTGDRLCGRCGYNLRGLRMEGACPECGASVHSTVKGNLLETASGRYLRTVDRGLTVTVWSVAAITAIWTIGLFVALYLGIVSAFAGDPSDQVLLRAWLKLCGSFPLAALAVGCWMFSSADVAGGRNDAPVLRVVLRTSAIAATAGSLLTAIVTFQLPAPLIDLLDQATSPAPSGLVVVAVLAEAAGLLGWAGLFFSSVLYVRWLSRRVPDEESIDRARRYLWLVPLVYILGACFIVGPMLAAGMYAYLFWRLQGAVHKVAVENDAYNEVYYIGG